MTVYSLENALLGVRSERPAINDPTIPRHGSQPPTYICIDTLDVFQDTGSAWLLVGRFGLAGLTPDGLTPAGIVVAGNVGSASATVGGDLVEPLALVTVTDDYAVLTTDQTILVGASGKTITLPAASTVPTWHTFDIKNTTAGDTTTVEPPQLAPPAAPIPTSPHSGGIVADGVYTVALTYTNALGETVASASASVTAAGTVADTSTLVIPSPSVKTGATGWNAYVSQAGGSSLTLQNVSPTLIGTPLTLTAPPTSGGTAAPTGSTASICAIDGVPTYTRLTAAKAAARCVSDGTDYWIL